MSPLSFFPLGPARTVPVQIKHARSHSQTNTKTANPTAKRVRVASTPSSPSKKRAVEVLTPAPSSDGPAPGPVAFKVPAVPARLAAPLTPSTSTVAASAFSLHLARLPRQGASACTRMPTTRR